MLYDLALTTASGHLNSRKVHCSSCLLGRAHSLQQAKDWQLLPKTFRHLRQARGKPQGRARQDEG